MTNRLGPAAAVILLAAMIAALGVFLAWGGPMPQDDHHGPVHSATYDTLAESQAHATIGSPTCIRFGGCGYLSHNDHVLYAVDNWGDGRTIKSWGRGCGRLWSVVDRDGKGGGVGKNRVPCNLKSHWLERISRDGLVSKFSGTSRHPN